MKKRGFDGWINKPVNNKVLYSFAVPQTPRQVERMLNINKLKMQPFLEKKLVKILNPSARKGRYYTLTSKARKLLNLPVSRNNKKNWNLIGFILSSPRQRFVVLKTLSLDSVKRTSEEIRERAITLNPHLSRTSMKGILKELINKNLSETKMIDGKRYYWISAQGISLARDIQ